MTDGCFRGVCTRRLHLTAQGRRKANFAPVQQVPSNDGAQNRERFAGTFRWAGSNPATYRPHGAGGSAA